jgi:hypothetical protein
MKIAAPHFFIRIIIGQIEGAPARRGVVVGFLIGKIDPNDQDTVFPGRNGGSGEEPQREQCGTQDVFQKAGSLGD